MAKHNPGDWWKLLDPPCGQQLTDVIAQITSDTDEQNLLGWRAVHYIAKQSSQEELIQEALEQVCALVPRTGKSASELRRQWNELAQHLQ